MATTVNLRSMLHTKRWEPVSPLPVANAAGHFLVPTPPDWPRPVVFLTTATSTHYLYDVARDAFIDLPGGTLGAHTGASTGQFHAFGPSGTASAGSTSTTLNTAQTAVADVAGCKVRITGGTGAGQERTITAHTFGANAIFTVGSAWTVTPDNTSTYIIMSGRFWILGATGAAVVWKYYDWFSNTWTAKSTTSGPGATWGTDGQSETPSAATYNSVLATGTATAGAAATLTNSGKSWATNKWANSQVRITGGTGAGQVRTINSNTGTVLTVSANWTVNPDATSTYSIEGNDDWIFVAGNNAVTLFRYAINGIAGLSANAQATGDTWITVSPGAARAAAGAGGLSLAYIFASTDPVYGNENTGYNGLRLYSFRGGATATLDYYDIAANTWVSGVAYGAAQVTFTVNSTHGCDGTSIWIKKEATGRLFKFVPHDNTLYPWSSLAMYPEGTATLGEGKVFLMFYVDGGTTIRYIYSVRHTGTEMFRMIEI